MEMTEREQEAYAEGQENMARRFAIEMLRYAGVEVGDPLLALATAQEELAQTRARLKELFEALNYEWPGDELHLGDVVEKWLMPSYC